MTFYDTILIHFKHQMNHCHVMVKTYYKKRSYLPLPNKIIENMKLLILYFSLYASKPAILDDIDNMEFEEVKPNNAMINGDMNRGYLKEVLKSA